MLPTSFAYSLRDALRLKLKFLPSLYKKTIQFIYLKKKKDIIGSCSARNALRLDYGWEIPLVFMLSRQAALFLLRL